MKLIIQIPCWNEEYALPTTLAALPRQIAGVDVIETLVIDDGSTDRTAEIARQHGVQHIVHFTNHKGLAAAFAAGLDAALRLGADIIVNTDADGQYPATDIPALIQPILEGTADMVIGDRRVTSVEHFAPHKRLLQKWGSAVVSSFAGLQVEDVTSGFRAYSREAALQLNILTKFTYTLETVIQAGHKQIALATVPTSSNPPTRPSRLFKGSVAYLRRSVPVILRIYTAYQPLKTFSLIGALMAIMGVLWGLRFVYFYVHGLSGEHVQSMVLSVILIIIGFQVFVLGAIADLIAINRHLIEEMLYRVRRLELESGTGHANSVPTFGEDITPREN